MRDLFLALGVVEILLAVVVLRRFFALVGERGGGRLMLALCGCVAALALWTSPRRGAEFPVSDGIEYSVGAWMLVHEGDYALPLEGERLPPRYQPWFSLVVAGPAIAVAEDLFGVDTTSAMGAPAVAVAILSVLLVMGVAAIVCALTGVSGGIVAAALVLTLPGARFFGQQALVDVPLALSTLGVVIIAARIAAGAERLSLHVAHGVLVACAFLLRPTALLVGAWWFFTVIKRRDWRGALAGALPVIAGLLLYHGYQWLAFGSPWRAGYNFWLAIPYDLLALTFHPRYLGDNIRVVLEETGMIPLFLAALGGIWFFRRRGLDPRFADAQVLLLGAVASAFALIAPQLLYFYHSPRLFLSAAVLSALAGGLAAGIGLERASARTRRLSIGICAAVGMLAVATNFHALTRPFGPPSFVEGAERIARSIPVDGAVISGFNPVALYPWIVPGTSREIIPVSRRVEFASKLLLSIPLRLTEEERRQVRDAFDHRAAVLKGHGAREAVRRVGIEDPLWIERKLREGTPMYLDITSINDDEWRFFLERFTLGSIENEMVRVHLRASEREPQRLE